MLKVKRENRVGFTAGCWRITRKQAETLCRTHLGEGLPRCGWEKNIRSEKGTVRSPAGVQFPTTFRAWVANRSNAEFILRDENGIIPVEET